MLGLAGDCGGVGCARAGSAKSARLATRELVFAFILALPPSQLREERVLTSISSDQGPPLLPCKPSTMNVTASHARAAFLKAERDPAFPGRTATSEADRQSNQSPKKG